MDRSDPATRRRVPYATITHKDNGFSIKDEGRAKTFEGRVANALKRIHPHRQELKALCRNYSAGLSVGVYVVGNDIPALHQSKEAVGLLADLDAEVDFDLYFLSEVDE